MRTIKTTTGANIPISPDPLEIELLTVVETVVHEVTVRHGLDHSYEDMMREVQHVVEQMTEDERRAYLVESLFHLTVRFENDKYEQYMRKLTEKYK